MGVLELRTEDSHYEIYKLMVEKYIQDANVMKSTVYDLPEEAIEETRKSIVYHIKERLKQHSRHVGNVCIMINCTESVFWCF